MLIRKGTVDDPYIDITEDLLVINNRVVLKEIPDKITKVRIDNLYEKDKNYNLNENEFYVDYRNGIISFNASKNGSIIQFTYKGKGIIQYPAERIFLKDNEMGMENLQDFTQYLTNKKNNLEEYISDTKKYVEDFIEKKEISLSKILENFKTESEKQIKRINTIFDNTKRYMFSLTLTFIYYLTKQAYKFTLFTKKWMESAQKYIDKIIEKIAECDDTIKEARNMITKGEKTTKKCKETTKECEDVVENSRLVWQPNIPSFLEINEKYPFPKKGWTTICDDNGDVIRFDGTNWFKIGNILGTVPLVTKLRNGLMTKKDKFKLDNIQAEAEKNLTGKELKEELPDELRMKSIIFTIPFEIKTGDLGYMIQAPFEGKITRISSYSENPAVSGTWGEFSILKSPLLKLNNNDGWAEITDKYNRVRFLGNSRIATDPNLLTRQINRYDVFRVICTRQAEGLSGVTIQIDYII